MLAYMYNKDEPWLLGLGPNLRALALWVNSVLAQNKTHSYYQNNGLHKKLSQVLQLENRVEFYNKNTNPTEVLGLSTYTFEVSNDFLKIREARLPNSR